MPSRGRIDTASRLVKAEPMAIYRAFVDAEALASWLPPRGMSGAVEAFDPRPGGAFRVTLTYLDPGEGVAGKTSDASDTVGGRFVELAPGERIVWAVTFVSDDPAFAGEMVMTWTFVRAAGGTQVSVRCENVPAGIRKEDHDAGLNSTLENLAAFVE